MQNIVKHSALGLRVHCEIAFNPLRAANTFLRVAQNDKLCFG